MKNPASMSRAINIFQREPFPDAVIFCADAEAKGATTAGRPRFGRLELARKDVAKHA